MINNEFNWYKLLNIPGFGTKSRYYVYMCLINKGLKIQNLFEMSINELESLLPEIGVGKFSRAKHIAILTLDEEKIFLDYQKLISQKISHHNNRSDY